MLNITAFIEENNKFVMRLLSRYPEWKVIPASKDMNILIQKVGPLGQKETLRSLVKGIRLIRNGLNENYSMNFMTANTNKGNINFMDNGKAREFVAGEDEVAVAFWLLRV